MTSAYSDALALQELGRYADAEAGLKAWLRDHPADRAAQDALHTLLLLQAQVTAPADAAARVALARALANLLGAPVLQGADEGARLQRAADMVREALPEIPQAAKTVAARILWRVADYDAASGLGGLTELGRYSAAHGAPEELLGLLTKVETDADRLELLHQHRLWAATLAAAAAARPIVRPPRTERGGPLRLGLLSSDLRHHVVAFFVQPLFEFLDPRFELYCYSAFPGPPDVVQPYFEGRAKAFRRLPPDDRDAAQMVAADDLDLLIELGGVTANSRPGVLAYRPAPLQASWLGYPHSLGLSAIDHIVADPQLISPRSDLLLEEPLLMPTSWICMAPQAFGDRPAVEPAPPVTRNGYVTFGTANDPYKFSPHVLRAWARVVAAVPNSRFMILRPEAGAPAFRENVARYFAEQGVGADRLDFRAVRGAIRPLYAEMDIALDTFPVTGGTTTCEALWMGVPTVSLRGEALYERLSASILANAGLSDLVAGTLDDYVRIAVGLALSPARLADLRATLRTRIRLSPLGQPRQFAADFYDLMARAIARRP